ncbi:MAG: hypothetical protein V3V74_07750 [Nitrosomonadaceae bacterium]
MDDLDETFNEAGFQLNEKSEGQILKELLKCKAYFIMPVEEAELMKCVFFGLVRQNGEHATMVLSQKFWEESLKDPRTRLNEIVYGGNKYKWRKGYAN